MQLVLYRNFNKKINSTKRPSGGIVKEVVLKQETSIESPTFLIDGIDLDVNYCAWNNHYYRIDDITLGNNDIYELHCSQDPLATYKTEIENYTGYVEYSSTQHNKLIPDKRLSMTQDVIINSDSQEILDFNPQGTYIISTAGSNVNAMTGFTNYYAINTTQAQQIANKLYDTNFSAELKKIFNDPFESIISCHWIPINYASTIPSTTVYFGAESTDIAAIGLSRTGPEPSVPVTLTIPWNYNDWRDFSPYSELLLYLPLYGTVRLDASKLEGQTTLNVRYLFDEIKGEVTYQVEYDAEILTFSANMAVSLPVGKVEGAKPKALGQVLSGGGALIGAGIASLAGAGAPIVAGAVLGGVATIGTGVGTYFMETSGAKGSQDAFAPIDVAVRGTDMARSITLTHISHVFSQSPDYINSIEGRPLFQTRRLGDLGGYVKCGGASIQLPSLSGDLSAVNELLNTGIWIE